MSLSFRPASHAERDQVVSAIQSLLSSPESDPTVLMLTSALLATPMAAYTAARAVYALVPGAADPFEGLGKIAALGIKVSSHCTYHGVALNVAMDLEPFSRIDPCGYKGLATVDLATLGVKVPWSSAAEALAANLERSLG